MRWVGDDNHLFSLEGETLISHRLKERNFVQIPLIENYKDHKLNSFNKVCSFNLWIRVPISKF